MLLVSHTTRLCYEDPVVEAHSEIRKAPVDTGLQRVVTSKLTVSPSAELRSDTDYFGNRVHRFYHLEPHTELEIRAESVLETTDAVCCGPKPPPDSRPWQQRLAEFLHWSPAVPRLSEYDEIQHRVSPDLEPDDFLSSLKEIATIFRDRFRYDADATDVHSDPKDLFEAGGGVCQDFAHAMLGVLRIGGVACRYVSGYVYDPADTESGKHLRGASASHAWVQAWHPGLGWVGTPPSQETEIA